MRIAVIGCGGMALKAHLPAWQAEGHDVVAAVDPTPARLELFRDAAGLDHAACSNDPEPVLGRADVEAVVVATPPAFRPSIVVAALEAGKHVLAEKPIAVTPKDGWAMVGAARSSGRRLAMVHNYLPRPDFAAIKSILNSGVIGQPYVVTLNFLSVKSGPSAAEYQPQWRRDARLSGGGVLMDMVHAVYLSQWLMGEPIRAVNAALGQRQSGTVEDLALCRFEFESGFAMVNMAWGYGPGGVEIMGTEGRLLLFNQGFGTCPFVLPEQLHVYRFNDRLAVDDSFLKYYAVPPQAADPRYPLRLLLRNFVDAVEGREELLAPGEHGVLALEAVVGAYASAARQKTVRLPLDPDDGVYQKGIHALLEQELLEVAV